MSSLSSKVAEFFSVIGDETRVKILGLIDSKPLTVNEIKDQIGKQIGEISLQALSYQLKKLEDHNLIRYERNSEDHRKKEYRIADDHVLHILSDTITHIQGGPECSGVLDCEDIENLNLLRVES
ncbi:MAG: ArsR/SmtB family transcription factor [Promethearchaeota archaeon]